MTNDINDTKPAEESATCIALSKNDSYVMSASGGKVSLFNMMTFKVYNCNFHLFLELFSVLFVFFVVIHITHMGKFFTGDDHIYVPPSCSHVFGISSPR